jgi:hypothetical protein
VSTSQIAMTKHNGSQAILIAGWRVKRSTNQEQADGSTEEKKELLWGYGTGVAAATTADYDDVTYFRSLYQHTVLALWKKRNLPYLPPAVFRGGTGRASPKRAARSCVISRNRLRLTVAP